MGWEYSNTNTVLAGLIVEQITGQPLAEVLNERIFEPLGMDHTLLPAVDDATIPDPHPHGYMFGTNVSTLDPDDTILSEDQQAAARAGTLRPDDYTNLNPSWGWAAGAGISTVHDLATYVEALVGGGLLSDQLQQLRIDSITPSIRATRTAPDTASRSHGSDPCSATTGHCPATSRSWATTPPPAPRSSSSQRCNSDRPANSQRTSSP